MSEDCSVALKQWPQTILAFDPAEFNKTLEGTDPGSVVHLYFPSLTAVANSLIVWAPLNVGTVKKESNAAE